MTAELEAAGKSLFVNEVPEMCPGVAFDINGVDETEQARRASVEASTPWTANIRAQKR